MAVLIPSYQPGRHLAAVVADLRRRDPVVHILVIDDGSGESYDQAFAEARQAGAEVLRFSRNRGKGAALRAGLAHLLESRPGEDVVTADSDGQHLPADILAVAASTAAGDELVLGCRDFSGEVPAASRIGNRISRRLFRLVSGLAVGDTQTGLRGIPGTLVPWALTVPGDRFEYEQNQLLRCTGAGVRVKELPIRTVYFEANAGTHFRKVTDSVRVMLPLVLFAASSVAAFVVDTLVFLVALACLDSIAPAMVLARLTSAAVNFALNGRIFTRRRRLGRAVAGYAALAIALLATSITAVSALTALGVGALMAKLGVEAFLFLASYRIQRDLVFGGGRSPHDSTLPRHSGLTGDPQLQLA